MASNSHRYPTLEGRGSSYNPKNRFEQLEVTIDLDEDQRGLYEPDDTPRKTVFYRDHAKTIINHNTSPDVGFEASISPYRGCEHGCSYCFARPTHEYLGFGSGLDFESKIMVKTDAPILLRKELSAKRWKPQVIAMSAITDVYQPLERKLELTRRCLEVLLDFRNPVGIITKNHLITRDVDLLRELASFDAVSVVVSITTLDEDLRRAMEPRTSTALRRLEAVRVLAEAGVHVGVLTAPIIPGLNDVEIPALVKAAVDAGAKFVGHSIVRLPHGVKDVFTDWLERHLPDRKNKVLNRIRSTHAGELDDARFGIRQRGDGIFAEQIRALHRTACRQAGLQKSLFKPSTAHFRVPGRWVQDSLFADLE